MPEQHQHGLRQDRRHGDRRPDSAAMPTAIIAPEISPPGRLSHRNSRPPAAPMTSVSSVPRILPRSAMAEDIDVGIRLTPPYGKSAHRRTNAPRDCSNAGRRRRWPAGVIKNAQGPDTALAQEAVRLVRLCSGGLLACGAEFPALLALKSLGVGLLRAFERGRGARLLGFLFRRRLRRRSWPPSVVAGAAVCADADAHQQQGSHGGRGGKGGDLVMGHLGLKTRAQPSRCDAEPQVNEAERGRLHKYFYRRIVPRVVTSRRLR